MQEAFKRAGIRLTFTLTYNPQSNSMERVHRDFNVMLRVLCHQHAADWEEVLPVALLALRSTVHESTGLILLLVFTGKSPATPLDVLCHFPGAPMAATSYVRRLEDHQFKAHRVQTQHTRLVHRKVRNVLPPPQTLPTHAGTALTFRDRPTIRNGLFHPAFHLTPMMRTFHHLVRGDLPLQIRTIRGSTRPAPADSQQYLKTQLRGRILTILRAGQTLPGLTMLCLLCLIPVCSSVYSHPSTMLTIPSRTDTNSLHMTIRIPPRFRRPWQDSAASTPPRCRRLTLPDFSSCKRNRKGI